MPEFASFDTRNYNMLPAREGYRLWSETYERTVKPDMDLRLLDALTAVTWSTVERAADLGCGTGRTGTWLKAHGVRAIDGIDLTPEMLSRAERTGAFDSLRIADACASNLAPGQYDLVTTCLVDEHLRDLGPLYRESARIAKPDAVHVLIGFHPFFIMKSGMPTHFPGPAGEPIAIETHVHLFSEHIQAALVAGWSLAEMREQCIDDRWIAQKPSWAVHRDTPISFALVWRRGQPRFT